MVYVPPSPSATKARPRAVKAPKYKNKKIEFRGDKFDSIGERDRYIFLLQEEQDGKIRNLERQVSFPFEINGQHICKYIADFVYDKIMTVEQVKKLNGCTITGGDGNNYWVRVVEDFKGVITDTFALKAKMFKAIHGYEITITKRPSWRSSNVMEGKSWKTK